MDSLVHSLSELIEGQVAWDETTLTVASRDTSLFCVRPAVVVYPKHEADVCALVKFVSAAKKRGEQISLTARAAGTCMTGGPLTTSIVVDFTKYFTYITPPNAGSAEMSAEPGVFYRDFEKISLAHNLLLPSFPASRDLCAIGGMVSNNSGGEKTLRYGKTEKYVRVLRVVFADGIARDVTALSAEALNKKCDQKDFEGEIYRTIVPLIKSHADFLKSHHPQVTKNSAGYALWNVWDAATETFDITKIFVGAQGTLGLITKATFALITPKKFSRSVVIFLKSHAALTTVVPALLKLDPETCESFDDHTFRVALRVFPKLISHMNGNLLSLGFKFLPEFWMLITGGVPKMIIIADFTGDTEKEALVAAENAAQIISLQGHKTHVARTEAEAEKYWIMRRESFNLLRHHMKGLRTAPFIDDLIVPPNTLSEFLPELYKMLDASGMLYTVAGHVGDGNFHIIPLVNPTEPQLIKNVEELMTKVFDLILRMGGSFTAEHNDGMIRTPFLKKLYGADMYDLFVQTKTIFDPQNIFNPGKKIGGSWETAKKYFDL